MNGICISTKGLTIQKEQRIEVYPFELINTLSLKIILLLASYKMNRWANIFFSALKKRDL